MLLLLLGLGEVQLRFLQKLLVVSQLLTQPVVLCTQSLYLGGRGRGKFVF